MGKQEFIGLFTDVEQLEDWFSAGELKLFSFPKNAGSLAARYLVKKRILEELSLQAYGKEIGIMNDEYGKPVIKFNDNIRKGLDKAGIEEISCSLSHSRNYIAVMTIFT
jgi:phosphopantetheinyl transferase (holo-ACP synthase)